MSTAPDPPARAVRISDLARWREAGQRFAMLTAYDAPTAKLLEAAGIPVLLVGDSVADAVLGRSGTVGVTLEEMVHHTAAVARGTERALVVADLPFGSYQVTVEDGMRAALRLVGQGGAHAVKAEGAQVELCARLVRAGVPFMGHVGLTPQAVHQLGGYRVQGRDAQAAQRLQREAQELAEAGAFAVVLEAVPAALAAEITAALPVPTIGIGAGAGCDAQVLVTHDLLGLGSGPAPRFVKAYADLAGVITDAATRFREDVARGEFPDAEHAYD